MKIRPGIGVGSGYAIGPAFLVGREEYRIERRRIDKDVVDSEIERLEKAFDKALGDIEKPLKKYAARLGPEVSDILEAHMKLLSNEAMREEIRDTIRQECCGAENAFSNFIRQRVKKLAASGQVSFVQRLIQDLTELEKSVLRHLLGRKREDLSHLTKPVIIVANDLSPAETLRLDRRNILGMITEVGGRTSHTAIVAASLGIPAVVGVEAVTNEISGGDPLILDGGGGKVFIHPDEATQKRYTAMMLNFQFSGRKLTEELHDLPAETKDGHRITMLANIESPFEIESALRYGAEGVGLYRTEFLYLYHRDEPTEEQHLAEYQRAVEALNGRKLVIRTLDLGADKMPLNGMPAEKNPFLGTRAIRLCMENPEMFKKQLRAIARVAVSGDVHVMYPMISSVSELSLVKEFSERIRNELVGEGFSGPKVPEGIMIEVPSAAVISDILAEHVDFMSIGTNDLIAYAMAVDRVNEHQAHLYQPSHPAIVRLIRHTIEAGEKAGKSVSVCGEMSSDLKYTLLLLGLGLRTFSVVPPRIPDIKRVIRSVSMDQARSVAETAVKLGHARKIEEYLHEETSKLVPDAF